MLLILQIGSLVLSILILILGIRRKDKTLITIGVISLIFFVGAGIPSMVDGFMDGWNSTRISN